ncbi:PaaI family thioesterase [Sulfurimonas sp. CVO]|jgi:acyl-CoA thioesterase|uniref:hotdog domain-containing protein n=1 Tax=Sulfurimonas sp. CVO TaxID=2283483 RepID=UPI000CB89A3E|nr:hotdog domain-containing protein [Sulfurimonas sp. CVO]PLY16428.1 MAG: thioesterase [Sulfurimonas sp.]QHG91372.1 PaaI family thioesterase [Sulfurimonas sp. CVO]
MNKSIETKLKTHKKINRNLCGEIQRLEDGFVELKFVTAPEMVADSKNLIHGGFIFGAADYAAMAAINEENVVLAASSCRFIAPVKLGDIVDFTAEIKSTEGRKSSVYVIGNVLSTKVFEGEFKTFVTEKHVLELSSLKTKNA